MECKQSSISSSSMNQLVRRMSTLQTEVMQLDPDAALTLFPHMTHLYNILVSRASTLTHQKPVKMESKEEETTEVKTFAQNSGNTIVLKNHVCKCRLVLLSCPNLSNLRHIPLDLPVSKYHLCGNLSTSSPNSNRWQSLEDLRNLVLNCFPGYPLQELGYDLLIRPVLQDGSPDEPRLIDDLKIEDIEQIVAQPSTTIFLQPHTLIIFHTGQEDDWDVKPQMCSEEDSSPKNRKRKTERTIAAPSKNREFLTHLIKNSNADTKIPSAIAPRPIPHDISNGNHQNCGSNTKDAQSTIPSSDILRQHELRRIPPTKKKMRPTKRCEQCRKCTDARKESRYYCVSCDKGFHRECFLQFHKEGGYLHYRILIDQEPA